MSKLADRNPELLVRLNELAIRKLFRMIDELIERVETLEGK